MSGCSGVVFKSWLVVTKNKKNATLTRFVAQLDWRISQAEGFQFCCPLDTCKNKVIFREPAKFIITVFHDDLISEGFIHARHSQDIASWRRRRTHWSIVFLSNSLLHLTKYMSLKENVSNKHTICGNQTLAAGPVPIVIDPRLDK